MASGLRRVREPVTESPAPLAALPELLAEEPALRAVIAASPWWRCPTRRGRCSWRRSPAPRPGGRCWSRCPRAPRPSAWRATSGSSSGPSDVELFPAWETLPFERVSPSLETMGRRLRVLWRLRAGGDHLPTVVVAPVRALVQRLGPARRGRSSRSSIRPGDQVDRDELVPASRRRRVPARVPGGGARRGGGARLDRRRVPVDRRPPRPHRPLGRRGRPSLGVRGRRPALHPRRRRGLDLPDA